MIQIHDHAISSRVLKLELFSFVLRANPLMTKHTSTKRLANQGCSPKNESVKVVWHEVAGSNNL
jgi:hypothetical protein